MESLRLINGSATQSLASADRGLAYGHGVFTTLRVSQGKILLWDRHLSRLKLGCDRLGFPISGLEKLLKKELGVLPKSDLVIKIIITAGVGARGYATPAKPQPTRIIHIDPYPDLDSSPAKLRLCKTQLARQPELAGIKHLNRLEQVLARSEWDSPEIAEGVMLDRSGLVVEGTYSNIFWFSQDELHTPDLSQAGVAGVMRAAVIDQAIASGIRVRVADFELEALKSADEVFLTNALIGMRAVSSFESVKYATGKSTKTAALQALVEQGVHG